MDTIIPTDTAPASPLALWRLISPMLPVGAYAYSQGLEYAVEAGWVVDEAGAAAWIGGVLGHTQAAVDVPILARLYDAWGHDDGTALVYWGALLRASREAYELVEEDRHLGQALARVLVELGVSRAVPWCEDAGANYATLFALAAHHWHIALTDTARGYLWAWCENQVGAAMKLVPLGQNAGQRLLSLLMPAIERAAVRGLALDAESIGATATGLGLASACHETQYSRLFRS